ALGDPLRLEDAHFLCGEGVDLLGDRDDVLVVGKHDDLVRGRRLHRLEDLRGGRVHRLTAGNNLLHAERVEDASDAAAGRHGDDGRGYRVHRRRRLVGRRLAHPTLLLHLFHEVGDADIAGAADVESRLYRGTDVVG